jgi:hypothetical protein
MKNIGLAILAVCLGTLGSVAAQAQYGDTNYGSSSLASESGGSFNSAFGQNSLYHNNVGYDNAAFGAYSLWFNTTGIENTAVGVESLQANASGSYNSAYGSNSLVFSTGSDNTASGYYSLYNNTNGGANAAFGVYALQANAAGYSNVAVGPYSLYNNAGGSNNIGIGGLAGYNNAAGSSYNIDIGSYGSANDNNAIRIGGSWNTSFFAAGIRGTKTGAKNAVEVMIDSNGQLGTVNSSIRFKEDVHDMAAASDGLMRLRPVTYRYKQPYADGSKPVDYGLIAEEVAEVYPDLVARDEDGQIQTVQYQKLTPMLLNEVQKEHKLLEQQAETVQQQAETIQQLEKRLVALETMLPSAKAEAQLAEK